MKLRGLVALLFAVSICRMTYAQQTNPFPNGIAVCEDSGVCGFMSFTGMHGIESWLGKVGALMVQKFDGTSVVIQRTDNTGTTVFVGTRTEDWITGTETLTPLNGGPKKQQKWQGAVQPVPVGDDPSTLPRFDIKKATLFSPRYMIPLQFTVCQASNDCGKWTFHGANGKGVWDNGVESEIKAERFLPNGVMFFRQDPTGRFAGIRCLYMGVIKGDHVDGILSFLQVGDHNPWVFPWHADLRAAANQPADNNTASSRPAPAAAPRAAEVSSPSTGGSLSEPPSKMKLCTDTGCENLTSVGDHYESHKDGESRLYARYWMTTWSNGNVEFSGKTAFAADGVYPAEGTYTGKISPAGTSITGGSVDWRVGYSKSGSKAFTLAWSKGAPNPASNTEYTAFKPSGRSRQHPNITMPADASEEFASFPDYMRAVLQPGSGLTRAMADMPCNATASVNADVALEIGKYAYRKADFTRGHCWLKRSADSGNVRAQVLLGASALMGWGTPKDPNAAFKIFNDTDGKRDPWNGWFLEKCYNEGIGVAQNKQLAGRIDANLSMRAEGQEMFRSIGADDSDVKKRSELADLRLNPPMKKSGSPVCRNALPSDGDAVNGKVCKYEMVVDMEELQRREDAINREP